jgi:hypothetical protein
MRESLGWFSLFDTSDAAPRTLEDLVFRRAPRLPDRWPPRHTIYQAATSDRTWGSVSPNARWTRLAVAALRPGTRDDLIKMLLASDRPDRTLVTDGLGRKWYDIAPLPRHLAGLVALHGVAENDRDRFRDPLAQSIAQLHHAIEAADATDDSLEARALREEVLRVGRTSSDSVTAAAEWFLALRSQAHDSALAAFALESPELLETAATIAASSSPVRRRAEGLLLSVERGEVGSLTSTILWWTDTRRYRSPAPVAAPTSLWLNDAALETEIRSRLDGAVARLLQTGISEETEVTGALLQQLATAFDPTEAPPQSLTTPPFTLEITSTNANTHEPISGSDIGIVVDIATDSLTLTTGHLVQIKQATNREESTPPSWIIGLEQLERILSNDPTATYWLIQQHHSPKVIAIPAKLLLAIARARRKRVQTTATWAYIRSASASLGQMLLDLLAGLWPGGHDEALVEMAYGRDSRHTPAALLNVRIRSGG